MFGIMIAITLVAVVTRLMSSVPTGRITAIL